MKLFDFVKTAQQKVEGLQKKAEAITEKYKSDPSAAFSDMVKTKASEKKEKIKQPKPSKPDRSIEGITKQILAARDNIVKNGYTHYEFIANRDCCDVCARLNGKHFHVSKLKIGVNAPPMHEGCRCSIAAWVDDKEYEAWLNSL